MVNSTRHTRRDMRIARRSVLTGMGVLALPGIGLAADGPRYGGTFIVATGAEPRHLNLNIATDIAIKLIANPIYSKLVGLKSDFTPRADLARSWTISPDGLTYTFHLQDGVLWHDGQKLTSDDVKFTFEKVLFAYHNIGKVIAPVMDRIETPDATTVVFVLKVPSDIFMTFVAGQGYIQARHVYEGQDIQTAPANLAPVGSGPFRFDHWTRGREVALERNKQYFHGDQPYVDRIVTRFIPDGSGRVNALQAGEVDYLAYTDLPLSAIRALQTDDKITVTSKGHEAWGSIVELMMNLDKAPFSNVKLRQALSQAIDRNFIIQKAAFGLTKPATGPISSDIAWAHDPGVRQYPYSVADANRLLDEAGFKRQGDTIRFKTSIAVERSFEAGLKAAQIIAEQLRAVGIRVEVRPMDTASAAEFVYVKRDYDMYITTLTTGPDPALGVQRQYVSSNIRPIPYTNGIGYRNPEVDKLFQQAADSSARAERGRLYKQISGILAEDAAMVWLYENTPYSAFRSEFGDLHSWAAESIYNYGEVYWKEGSPTRS